MAVKKKTELKDVFNGVSSLFYTSSSIDLSAGTIEAAWSHDLPVHVDTLTLTQDDPTINHYKVIGINGDWTSSAESGDFNVEFTVPTKATEVLKLAFGESAYKAITSAKITAESEETWTGDAIAIDKHKISGSIGLLDEAGENLMLVTGIALYATPVYENTSTEPFAIKFKGTIETDGTQNMAWLKKSSAAE